jgi:hypothetical protein
MHEISIVTGGVRVGWANASWPLAKLSVSRVKLSISAMMLGTYTFTPDQIVALEPYGSIPLFGRGIRILHSRSDYPEKIVFWCFRRPERLLDEIRAAGFLPQASETALRSSVGLPVRWTAIIAIVVAWNTLFLLDGSAPWNPPKIPGPFVILAVALAFVAALALQRSEAVQAWALKPGRSVTEIAPALLVLQLVSGLMLIGLILFSFVGRSAG